MLYFQVPVIGQLTIIFTDTSEHTSMEMGLRETKSQSQ